VRRRLLGGLVVVLAVLVLAVLAGGFYVRSELRASLPALEGSVALPGLSAPVTVTRDALGVPSLTGASRVDVARAVGFVHAQDRFFQMDLQRRQPAGELSALVGERAVAVDAQVRVHRFRRVAQQAYARADPEWQALLDAYAAGVNAGLARLSAPPFEYLMLRVTPAPWRAEDSILTLLAMFVSLQGRQAIFEQTNQQLRAALPEEMFRFLAEAGSAWDSPADGGPLTRPPVPGPEVIDLRGLRTSTPHALAAPLTSAGDPEPVCRTQVFNLCVELSSEAAATIGSNNWAVDGARSANGGALVANDMHLGLGVPNIWYRISMSAPDPGDPLQPLGLVGLTLPGLPVLVVGSNGSVAWGFTNTGGDWSDLVRIEPDPRDPARYLTPDGPVPFESTDEAITIKDAPARSITVRSTIWGPIVWTDHDGREYAQHWVAHDPDVVSSDLSRPERVRTVDELMVAVAGLGMPNQNVAIADRAGRIAWTIGGALPRRRGLDGFTSESWADGTRGWDGYVSVADFPKIVDPEQGRLWTANAPVVDGVMLGQIGDGGYSDGIRARIIRDRLMAIDRATPRKMLDVQLDHSALFLDRWRTLLLETLGSPAATTPVDRAASRAEFRRLAETTWTGQASPDSVAYRLVRTFRAEVVRSVLGFVTSPARAQDPSFDHSRAMRTEGPVWELVSRKPLHLLDNRFSSWDALLLDAVDTTIAQLAEGGALAERTWGEVNRSRILHPLSSAVPLIHRWLNMPEDPLPGDVFTPRAHSPGTGPSERMVVSPGHEEEGILHMPTGQSAHPLSPYFGTMHRAWVNGDVVAFLPGPAQHALTLTP
jgi:penicillin amidase